MFARGERGIRRVMAVSFSPSLLFSYLCLCSPSLSAVSPCSSSKLNNHIDTPISNCTSNPYSQNTHIYTHKLIQTYTNTWACTHSLVIMTFAEDCARAHTHTHIHTPTGKLYSAFGILGKSVWQKLDLAEQLLYVE